VPRRESSEPSSARPANGNVNASNDSRIPHPLQELRGGVAALSHANRPIRARSTPSKIYTEEERPSERSEKFIWPRRWRQHHEKRNQWPDDARLQRPASKPNQHCDVIEHPAVPSHRKPLAQEPIRQVPAPTGESAIARSAIPTTVDDLVTSLGNEPGLLEPCERPVQRPGPGRTRPRDGSRTSAMMPYP
jgi:hypothetical protein